MSSAELLQPATDHQPVPSTLPQGRVAAWGGAGLATDPPVTTSPWVSSQTTQTKEQSSPSSFRDLMSEDLAQNIQDQENAMYYKALIGGTTDVNNIFSLSKVEDTSEDLILAQVLQYEFDREYDQQLNREERHYNGNSKVSVSFNKFKICPDWYGPDSDDEPQELDEDNRDFDSFEARERDDPVIPACGYVKHGKGIVTKHDLAISGRKNAERIMNLPPGINTGDGGGFDMHLSNKVYNKLQRAAIKENKGKNRVHDKVEKATAEMALDPNTRLLIFKLVNNAILESVNGVISSGKEAVVIHAKGGQIEEKEISEECAVKVFKTTLTDFKTRERYIREDYRFKDRMTKNNTQKSIRLWAEKEYHNLRRLQRAAIPSPEPILIKQHVLVMSFIGRNHQAAPKLKDAYLSSCDLSIAYEQVVEAMVKMFQGCHLVHADLSEYNILWHEGRCWIIDVGQAVEPSHPHALHFLHRDCSNIIKFFQSKGLPQLPTPLQLFEKVSGISLPGPEDEAARMIYEYEAHQELWRQKMNSTNRNFEFLWEEIQAEEKLEKEKNKMSYRVEEEEEDEEEEEKEKEEAEESDDLLEEFVVIDETGEELIPPAKSEPKKSILKKEKSIGEESTSEIAERLAGCSLEREKHPDKAEGSHEIIHCRVSFLDEDFPSLSSGAQSGSPDSKTSSKQGKKKKAKNRKIK